MNCFQIGCSEHNNFRKNVLWCHRFRTLLLSLKGFRHFPASPLQSTPPHNTPKYTLHPATRIQAIGKQVVVVVFIFIFAFSSFQVWSVSGFNTPRAPVEWKRHQVGCFSEWDKLWWSRRRRVHWPGLSQEDKPEKRDARAGSVPDLWRGRRGRSQVRECLLSLSVNFYCLSVCLSVSVYIYLRRGSKPVVLLLNRHPEDGGIESWPPAVANSGNGSKRLCSVGTQKRELLGAQRIIDFF